MQFGIVDMTQRVFTLKNYIAVWNYCLSQWLSLDYWIVRRSYFDTMQTACLCLLLRYTISRDDVMILTKMVCQKMYRYKLSLGLTHTMQHKYENGNKGRWPSPYPDVTRQCSNDANRQRKWHYRHVAWGQYGRGLHSSAAWQLPWIDIS